MIRPAALQLPSLSPPPPALPWPATAAPSCPLGRVPPPPSSPRHLINGPASFPRPAHATDVETVCATRSGDAAVFRVSFNSPCKGGASDTTYMTVDTTPKKCRKAYDPKLAKW